MTKKLLAICLAAIGFGGLLPASASAHQAARTTVTTAAGLPAKSHVDATVVLEAGVHSHHHYRHHYRHHYYRHHYYRHHYYRHHHYRHHHYRHHDDR